VRKTDLTFEEWDHAIEFPDPHRPEMHADIRQEFILLSDVLGVSMLVDAVNHREREGATETTVLGPFYVGEHKRDAARHRYLGEPRRRSDVRAEPRHRPRRQAAGRRRSMSGTPTMTASTIRRKPSYADRMVRRSRARFVTDADGRFSFRTILPCSYPIPTDGPVGALITATKRHPMRPAHVHFLVKAEGYEPLITHVFLDGDEYLRSDVVFGVKDELVARVEPKRDPVLPNSERVSGPWHLMTYDFQMKPGAGLVPQPMMAAE
jgi:hydroxyquinol 1,2-dioxygenase